MLQSQRLFQKSLIILPATGLNTLFCSNRTVFMTPSLQHGACYQHAYCWRRCSRTCYRCLFESTTHTASRAGARAKHWRILATALRTVAPPYPQLSFHHCPISHFPAPFPDTHPACNLLITLPAMPLLSRSSHILENALHPSVGRQITGRLQPRKVLIMATSNVVVATGYSNKPHIPEWPGQDTFPGHCDP